MGGGFGAFGKMPTVGDFFRLNTPAGFVSVWDDWIQRAMLLGRSALGSAWDDHYMSAPIWRFSLSVGLTGSHKVVGVLMPSVDRVGRRFPLTLMAPLTGAGPVSRDHFRGNAMFEALEALALDALEDDMSREKLEQKLAQIDPVDTSSGQPLHKTGRSLALCGKAPDGPLQELSAEFVDKGWLRPSLWSAMIGGQERLMICDGLPEGPEIQGLFHLNAPIWSEGPTG